MNKILSLVSILFLMGQLSVSAEDADSLVVAGTEIEGLLDANRPGPYNEIFNRITAGYMGPVVMNIAPIKRAARIFASGEANCLYVGSDDPSYYTLLGIPPNEVMISKGIYSIRIRIYSARGSASVESNNELSDKVIAMDVGVGSVEHVANMMGRPLTNTLAAQSLIQGFQMLDMGRVAALVAIDTDVKYLQQNDARYKGYSVSDTFNVHSGDDVLVCRSNAKTVPFMEYVNAQIDTLKEQGVIQQILDKSFLGREGR